MSKKIFVLFFAIMIVGSLHAQYLDRAIGIRFNESGTRISYQQPLGFDNRLEVDLDLGLDMWGATLNGFYQWVWNFSTLAGSYWYVGVGPIFSSDRSLFKPGWKDNIQTGVLAQVGIEFNFNIPFQVSVDYCPGFYFLPSSGGYYDDLRFGIRYTF